MGNFTVRADMARNRLYVTMGEEVLGKMQLNRISQEAGIPVAYVISAEAAEALLTGK